jgi:hypothetical protein
MTENRKDTQGSRRAEDAGRDDGDQKAREAEETGRRHQANVNQVRDEPMPASQYDDPQDVDHAAES